MADIARAATNGDDIKGCVAMGDVGQEVEVPSTNKAAVLLLQDLLPREMMSKDVWL